MVVFGRIRVLDADLTREGLPDDGPDRAEREQERENELQHEDDSRRLLEVNPAERLEHPGEHGANSDRDQDADRTVRTPRGAKEEADADEEEATRENLEDTHEVVEPLERRPHHPMVVAVAKDVVGSEHEEGRNNESPHKHARKLTERLHSVLLCGAGVLVE